VSPGRAHPLGLPCCRPKAEHGTAEQPSHRERTAPVVSLDE
jgi:hypothetical protein